MRKMIKIGLGVILIMALPVFFLPMQNKMDTRLEGVEYRIGDKNYSQNVVITVKGVYKRYLLRKDRFEGEISIDKYDFTHDGLFIVAPAENREEGLKTAQNLSRKSKWTDYIKFE